MEVTGLGDSVMETAPLITESDAGLMASVTPFKEAAFTHSGCSLDPFLSSGQLGASKIYSALL